MATYPQTGSTLDKRIVTGLSTLITVKVNNTHVGALQSLTINQARDIVKHQEIGTDGMVDNHPKGAANITLEATRLVFDGLSITEAFARGFFNIQAQRIPFDIQIIDRQQGDGKFAVVHTLHSCWFTRVSTPYSADNFLITQTASMDCLKITTQRMGESAVVGGIRGIGYEFDVIERRTDVRGIPGRFDSAGQTFSNNTGVSSQIKNNFGQSGGKGYSPGQS